MPLLRGGQRLADGSAEMVAHEFPQAILIASPVNGGYPYGNNLGLRHFG